MKTFYEAQRKRMGVLVDGENNPVGGRWSYDDENRKKFPLKATPPDESSYGRMQTKQEKEVIEACASELLSGWMNFWWSGLMVLGRMRMR